MVQGLPQAEPGYKWVLQLPEGEKRRSPWPWIISIVVGAALLIGGWFIAEWFARDTVERTIRTQITTALEAPRTQEIDVEVVGLVLPQLIAGTLDRVTIVADDFSYESFRGDVEIEARDILIHEEGRMSGADATVTLDQTQLRAIAADVMPLPADTLGLGESTATLSTQIELFGAVFAIGVAFSLGADEGSLTFAPAEITAGDAQVTADDLRAQLGELVDPVLQPWEVCVAQYLPRGLALADARVTGGALVIELDVDGGILSDRALRERGTCDAPA